MLSIEIVFSNSANSGGVKEQRVRFVKEDK